MYMYLPCSQVQKRGDDLAMPSLLKREKGILKKLKHEQVWLDHWESFHTVRVHVSMHTG